MFGQEVIQMSNGEVKLGTFREKKRGGTTYHIFYEDTKATEKAQEVLKHDKTAHERFTTKRRYRQISSYRSGRSQYQTRYRLDAGRRVYYSNSNYLSRQPWRGSRR